MGAALLGTATCGDGSFKSEFSRQAPDTPLETRLLTVTGANAELFPKDLVRASPNLLIPKHFWKSAPILSRAKNVL